MDAKAPLGLSFEELAPAAAAAGALCAAVVAA